MSRLLLIFFSGCFLFPLARGADLVALEKKAKAGDAEAQYRLAAAYATGAGVAQDLSEAFRWVQLAADQGLATAQNNLGVMYLHGQGVEQSDEEAVRYYLPDK